MGVFKYANEEVDTPAEEESSEVGEVDYKPVEKRDIYNSDEEREQAKEESDSEETDNFFYPSKKNKGVN